MKRLVFALAVLTTAASLAPAQAEDCTLRRVAALKLQPVANGRLAVPVTLGGKPALFAFDISDPFSYVRASFADAAGFEKRPLPEGVHVGIGNGHITELEMVPSLSLGNASGQSVQMLRVDLGDKDVVGELAMDVLSNFDIELDVANGAANLYTHDHCDHKVVYWSTEAYAEVPYRTDASGHPSFEMQLDGKKVSVALTMDPQAARMSMAAAHRLFGIDEKAPGLTALPNQQKRYRYPFKTLAMEGISISNPAVVLYGSSVDAECRPNLTFAPGDKVTKCFGESDLRLGQQELRALHIFMATKEKVVYVTAAQAHTGEPRKITP
jgi:hypothetical protein